MKEISEDRVVCFDVDRTLVTFNWTPDQESETVEIWNEGFVERVLPHKKHIKLMREFKARGFFIIVWSDGGKDWAKKVAEVLGLSAYVDIVCSKPLWYVDDVPANKWMMQRVYKKEFLNEHMEGEDSDKTWKTVYTDEEKE